MDIVGIRCNSTLSVVLLDGINHFEWNHGNTGGAVQVHSASVTLYGENYFLKNKATLKGGAILAGESSVSMKNTESFIPNSAQQGGSYYCTTN